MNNSSIQGFASSRRVIIDGTELSPVPSQQIINHSPDGFAWGYSGSGPSQLALAILLHYSDENFATEHYQDFKTGILAKLPSDQDFDIPAKLVTHWIDMVREATHA